MADEKLIALDPSREELAVLARAALLFEPTKIDERGCGTDYVMKESVPVDDLPRFEAICAALQNDLTGGLDALFSSPFAAAMREASYNLKHPYWMNAPFSGWHWLAAGCPGLVARALAQKDNQA